MTEETQTQPSEVVTEKVQPEQTLDELYKESGLEIASPAAQPQQQAVPAPAQQAEVNVPDPYDIEAHKAFIANLARNQTVLHSSLQQAQEIIAKKERDTLMAKLEEDITQASEFVSKESGIENPKLATFELSERARTDPKFKALWEGRESSPQAKAAFTKALQVVSREIGKKYEIKTDPTLVANKKALAASRQSSSTTAQEKGEDDGWSGLSPAEFQAKWERTVRNNL